MSQALATESIKAMNFSHANAGHEGRGSNKDRNEKE
jgi:hypothetical protein